MNLFNVEGQLSFNNRITSVFLFTLLTSISVSAQFSGVTFVGDGIIYSDYGALNGDSVDLTQLFPFANGSTVTVEEDFWKSGFTSGVDLTSATLFYKDAEAAFGVADDGSWSTIAGTISAVGGSDNDRATFDLTGIAEGTSVIFYIKASNGGYTGYAYPTQSGWSTSAPTSTAQTYSIRNNGSTTLNTKRIDGLYFDWQSNEEVDDDGSGRSYYISWDADYFYVRMEGGFGDFDRINIGIDENPGSSFNSVVGAFAGATFTGYLTPEYVIQSVGTTSLNKFERSGTGWSGPSDIYGAGSNMSRSGSNAEIRIARSDLGGIDTTDDVGLYIWLANGSDQMYSGFGLDNYPSSFSSSDRRMRTAYVWDANGSGLVVNSDVNLDHNASEVSRTLGFTTGIRNLYMSANTALTQAGSSTTITGEVLIRPLAGLELQNDINIAGDFFKDETGIFTHNMYAVNLNGNENQEIEVDFGTDTLSITFYDLFLSGSGDKILEDSVFITNDLTISGTARMVGTAQYVQITGDLDATSADPYSGGTSNLSEVVFNGTGSRTLDISDEITFRNLTFNSTGTFAVNGDIEVSVDTMEIIDATVGMGTNTLSGSGVLKMNSGTLQLAKLSTTLPEISNTVLAGSSTLQLNGAGDQTIRGNRAYANITLSNTGTKNFTSAPDSIKGTLTIEDDVVFDADNLTIGGIGTNITMTGTSRYLTTGSGTKPDASGTYNLDIGTTFEFAKNGTGNQTIRLSPDYANIVISGESPANASTSGSGGLDFIAGGSFTVTSTGTFRIENPGGFSGPSNAAVDTTGGVTITLEAGSTIEYRGSSQTITNDQDYYNLTFNDAGTKTPAGLVIVQGDLNLIEGIVELGANDLTMTDPAAEANGDDDGYIITNGSGRLVRTIDDAATGVYTFPLGNSTDYQPATITWGSAAGIDELSAGFIETSLSAPTGLNSSAYGSDPTPITEFLDNGYWEINSTGSGSPADYDIELDARSIGNLGALAEQHAIFKNSTIDPATWSEAGSPVDVWAGTPTATAGFGGQITPQSEGVSGFSIFAIGRSASNVLPITLLSFTAEPVFGDVLLEWSTVSEIDNDYFVLEHSVNGIDWMALTQQAGAGTTTVQTDYSFLHEEPLSGTNYYRLLQVDFNGASAYSDVVSVFLQAGSNELSLYPNPANDFIMVGAGVQVLLYNPAGQLVLDAMDNGNGIGISDLAPGIYLARLSTAGMTQTTKLIVE